MSKGSATIRQNKGGVLRAEQTKVGGVRHHKHAGPRGMQKVCSAHLAPANPGEEAAALGALALARAAMHKAAATAHLAPPLYQLRSTQPGSQLKLISQHTPVVACLEGCCGMSRKPRKCACMCKTIRLVCKHLEGLQAYTQTHRPLHNCMDMPVTRTIHAMTAERA